MTFLYSCSEGPTKPEFEAKVSTPTTPMIDYVLTNTFAHDTSLFTEGLLFHNGQLFESTGSPADLAQTKSLIGISDLKTGKFSPKVELDKTKYFGEGIVFINNKLYQLTYKNKLGFIYDAKSFKNIGTFKYSNIEGWGLTTDGASLIMSDGTSNISYLDPIKFSPHKILKVTDNGYPVFNLNELEFVKGFIYANIWTKNLIVKIDTSTGNVVGKIDLSPLTNETKMKNPGADVLNGIAYDSTTDKIYVTGKLWPNIYQIQISN